MNGAGFLGLQNRYVIEGRLKALAPLHVGGEATDRTDAGVFRDADGVVLPGSSVRGVLRSGLERLLQAVGGERGCVLFAEKSHRTCFTVNRDGFEAFKRGLKGSPSEQEEMLARKLFEEDGLCDICRLFGSPLNAGRLRVADCRPLGGTDPRTNVRDGVAIDRDTESAREKLKFDYEVVEAGAEFGFRLQVDNATETDFALLAMLLRELVTEGMDFGGMKARGLGRCRLAPDYAVRFFDRGNFERFLRTGQLELLGPGEFDKKLQDCLDAYLAKGKEAQDAADSGKRAGDRGAD